MAIRRRKTERRRPECALGGTLEGLSFPQHELHNDPTAVQKQKLNPVTTNDIAVLTPEATTETAAPILVEAYHFARLLFSINQSIFRHL